jgi:hypothetical protein
VVLRVVARVTGVAARVVGVKSKVVVIWVVVAWFMVVRVATRVAGVAARSLGSYWRPLSLGLQWHGLWSSDELQQGLPGLKLGSQQGSPGLLQGLLGSHQR